ncbi:MAG: hypothetical protein IJI66_03335 [Erysipelotrichaceae bacterium]|nr:hypothetical protein [Erysipelotrichaceae bacterium]
MSNNNNVITVRLDGDCLTKLDKLLEFEKVEARRIKKPEGRKKDIIEEAIRDLYYKKINKTHDADVVGRISQTVDDKVNASMNNLHGKIDQILYLVNKLDLGTKVLYRSPSVMPAPKDVEQAIRIITNEESKWYNAVEEIMTSNIKKKDEGEE